MLNSLNNLAVTGVGVSALAAIAELQGLNVSLLAGAGGGVKNPLAAIRPEDTIIAALNNNAGTITSVGFVAGAKATGTLTFAAAIATDTFVVNGVTFTIKTSLGAGVLTDVYLGANNTAQAAFAAAAINAYFADTDNSVVATSALGVVTVTSATAGTGSNSYTTVGGARITAGAATMLGGTADAGVTISPVAASGTLTFAAAVDADTFVVKGVTFTIKTAPAAGNIKQLAVGATNKLMASYAAKAINKYFNANGGEVVATVANNVVTITATAEGTAANAYTTVGGAHITAGAGTLAGGTATGGISVVAVTNQVILFWFNKK